MLLPLPQIVQSPSRGAGVSDAAGGCDGLRRNRASGVARGGSARCDGLLRSGFAGGADEACPDGEDCSLS